MNQPAGQGGGDRDYLDKGLFCCCLFPIRRILTIAKPPLRAMSDMLIIKADEGCVE